MRIPATALLNFLAGIACAVPTASPNRVAKPAVYGSVVNTTDSKPATTSTGTLLNRNSGTAVTSTAGGH